jgi:hypothetical protein
MFDTEPSRGYPSLAKMAAFFASLFIICIGVCGYSTSHGQGAFGGALGFLSFIGMVVSAISLFAIGIAGIISFIGERYYK